MGKNTRGLYISYFYLPVLVPRSIVSYKHLENSKYQFDVYAADVNRSENDKILAHTKDVNIIREVKIKSFYDKIKYIFKCRSYFAKNSEKYDFIFSSFMPIYSLVGAMLIKKKFKNVPWISYYSDPPATNFNLKISFFKKCFMFFEKKMVEKSYKLADVLLFTNEEQKLYCLKGKNAKYLNKAKILHHSYEEKLYKKNKEFNDKIVISHFGRLFGERNALNFLEALYKLKKDNFSKYEKIECRFYGNISDEHKKIIEEYHLDCVKIMGFVNYRESLDAMVDADYLLCIDAFLADGENVFFPSKLADYIGAMRKIIGIVPADSTSARIIKQLGFEVLSNDVEDIYLFLSKLSKDESFDFSKNSIYSAVNVSHDLDNYIEKITNK